jgi:glycosidase
MNEQRSTTAYFPHAIQISIRDWARHDLGAVSRLISERGIPRIVFYRQLALKLNRQRSADAPLVHAGQLNLYATLQDVFRYLIDVTAERHFPGVLEDGLRRSGMDPADEAAGLAMTAFVELFPPQAVLAGAATTVDWLGRAGTKGERRRDVLRELLLLRLASRNQALDSFREILDDGDLSVACPSYPRLVAALTEALAQGPQLPEFELPLLEVLLAPLKASPGSLAGQVTFIREQWGALLPAELLEEVESAFDILLEEERERGWGGEPGPAAVLEFGPAAHPQAGAAPPSGGVSVFAGYDYPEYEQFSSDADWMSNVVLMAKMVYVWLDQLSRQHGYPITRLDQIPDAELERLASAGFTGLWLIGVWERSSASQQIKQLCGNPDAIASAYSLYDYEIAADLGGWEALANLRERALRRGIRLASDMVPNHTGIYSRWVLQHPDWFVQTEYPPFPTYQFNGEDLSRSGDVCIQIEDGYWTKTDAAVVFRLIERTTGRTRYIYHGNDGTSIPWNDTAQLNYLIPEVREAVIQTILHVARNFPIIRFDAAMTLAKKHFQRLWFPLRGLGGGIPSRAEHGMSHEEFNALFPVEFWREVVDRVAAEVPDTLLLAEAFWMMEGYFVRTLGMHRVYNSAFMNMLKQEENAKYRKTIRNVLEFNPEILKRFVNFMNNPDEKTAVAQFGSQGKYFGACLLMITMPGLPMFGHGQIEGLHEKYGMEYKRAYWDEEVDTGLVRGHEMWIFPLLRRRWLFSGSDNFVLYDFQAGAAVDENVFAYSNRCGDQKALVFYHNRYAATAGWIRESTAYAVSSGDGQRELVRTTLSSALGLAAGEGHYHAFRDATSGLEFLRSGRELAEKGLYAELGEYEFHVFVDFRGIQEDGDGSWGALCTVLGGRGVESLEDERRQVAYASLNSAFRTVLEQVPQATGNVLAAIVENGKEFTSAIGRFRSVLAAQAGDQAAAGRGKPADLFQAVTFLASQLAASPTSRDARSFQGMLRTLLDTTGGACLLAAWLLLRGGQPSALEHYGLDCSLRRILLASALPDQGEADAGVLLLRALLALELDGEARGMKSIPVERLFGIPACGAFMLVHESEGMIWFNQERFEKLLLWLLITRLADMSGTRPPLRTVAVWLGAAGREMGRLSDLAAASGYRRPLFIKLAGMPPKKRPSGKK